MDHPPQPRPRVRLLKTETLGSGAYGVVCKAMYGQRLCAAKLLHPIFFQSNDPGTMTIRRRFEQECRFLNDMQHPNIVEYFRTTHDPDTGLLVLLMELCDENLTHFLEQSQQPLANHIEVDLCHDIAQALAYIHYKKIIHRDLSSNNILLIAGKAKITDFGMSKLLDENQRNTLTTCPGNAVYMPPEALGDPPVYSKKMDCFSFGVLQIQIMTRQFPDPSPTMQVVEDSRSLTGSIKIPVLDSERRKSHIDRIDPTHALLPTALSCLSYLEKDRPSANDLCRQLATFKEMPHYTQSMQQAQLRERNEEQAQQIHQLLQQLQTLQQELQTKDRALQDRQRHMDTLQQELQTKDQLLRDSQRRTHTLQQELQGQIQQLTHQVEEKQHTIDDRETQLRQLNQRLQANEQVTVEFQRNLLQLKQTNKQEETVGQLMQQKTIRKMKWQKESKAPEKMDRGSSASDSNMAYFNGCDSTKVYSYDSDTHKWHRLPDTPHKYSTLVVVQHILTMVGGYLSGKRTNSLLSLMEEGGAMKWLPLYPAMLTARSHTAAVCSGHSLIVAGGSNGDNRLATVEVLDTDTKQWSTACSLPHPFSSATISKCGEQLYLMDGYNIRSVVTCSVHELLQCQKQPLTGKLRTAPAKQTTKWQHITNVPHNCSSCTTLCGQLVAVGGFYGGKDTAAIFGYNATTDSWEAMGDMPTARRYALVAIVNEKLMAVGGHVGGSVLHGTATDVVEILC